MSVFADLTQDIIEIVKNNPVLSAYQKKHLCTHLPSLNIYHLSDLISHLPVEYETRDHVVSLHDAINTQNKCLVKVRVLSHALIPLKKRNTPLLKIIIEDANSLLPHPAELHCYGRLFLKTVLPIGKEVFVWGIFTKKHRTILSSRFEVITQHNRKNRIVPRYKLPRGIISQHLFSTCIQSILKTITIPNLHNYHKIYMKNIPTLTRNDACQMIHIPNTLEEITLAQEYFSFDEILLFHLSMKNIKSESKSHRSEISQAPSQDAIFTTTTDFTSSQNKLTSTLIQSLPFSLTKGQISVINEIHENMKKDAPMRRLLQGDVGSGKTIVALCLALYAIEQGMQVCLVVPSESLALQHYRNIKALFDPLGVSTELLTGSTKLKQRRIIVENIASHTTHFVVGTHALYSKDVIYHNLGFIIIDEQHRFGISQRSVLIQKGNIPDVLLMSATPIPRSLALTLYSAMQISTLTERPAIRQKVITRITLEEKLPHILSYIKKKISKREQVFFVFPQIENERSSKKNTLQSQNNTIASAEALYPIIKEALHPHTTALLHSRIPDEECSQILEKFTKGDISALVATTIIEVGIDIPNAAIMCVFDSQRFGLSTLHQLRGRVGRGSLPGETILIYKYPLSDMAKQRLKIMYEEIDGFIIAEQDLKLRGPGDIHQLGSRQSGSLLFLFADILSQKEILLASNECTQTIMQHDPSLTKEEHLRLKYHLNITKDSI